MAPGAYKREGSVGPPSRTQLKNRGVSAESEDVVFAQGNGQVSVQGVGAGIVVGRYPSSVVVHEAVTILSLNLEKKCRQ